MQKILNNPIKKASFCFLNIVLIGINNNLLSHAFIFLWTFILLILKDVSSKKKITFFLPALVFVVPTLFVQSIFFESGKLIFKIDYDTAVRVFTTLTAVSLFALDIKIKELYYIFRTIKIPEFLCEIIIYMFKFLTIMLKNYKEVKLALINRGAFNSFKKSFRDTGYLFNGMFKKVYSDMENFNTALYCRNYQNTFKMYEINYSLKIIDYFLGSSYLILFTLILKELERCFN
ncbi:MAG: energy-coupling factor transporter transmembrane component T family protein [Cetobacterium sp.]|uniref:energy-coupling factor transporter transmembrane component T family protein n=1 Tax=Cetobacterium sp. TaxID=2071632 RepID=UPI003F387F3B